MNGRKARNSREQLRIVRKRHDIECRTPPQTAATVRSASQGGEWAGDQRSGARRSMANRYQ